MRAAANSSSSSRCCSWRRPRRRVVHTVVTLTVASVVWTVMFSSWNVCRPDLDDDVDALNAASKTASSRRRPDKICLSPETLSGRRVNMSIDSDADLQRYNVSASAAKPYTSIIHVMWTTSEVPGRWNLSSATWVAMNRDFAYCLWTDPNLEAFVADEYPWLLSTYRGYRYHIQRCDVARYLLLYRYGGVYADLDDVCRAPLWVVFAGVPLEAGMLVAPTRPFGFTQDFVAVRRPRDPVVRGLVSGVRRAAVSRWYPPLPYTSVLYRTGPVYFTRRVDCRDRRDQIHVIPPSHYPEYVGYVGGASWHGWDGWIIWNLYRLLRYRSLVLLVSLLVIAVIVRFYRNRIAIVSY